MVAHRPTENRTDLRAPRRFRLAGSRRTVEMGLRVAIDLFSLAAAWKLAAYLNQFYLPLPPQLDWGTWIGLPGLFWPFAAVTIALFCHYGSYSETGDRSNYVLAAKLVSVAYFLSLVLGYFYDPKLDAPRSLFFTAWFASIIFVVGLRLITTPILQQFAPAIPIFILASPRRSYRLAEILTARSRYQIVGVADARTARDRDTLDRIVSSGAREVLAASLPPSELASTLYWHLRKAGITLRLLPSSLEMLHRRGVPEICAGLPTLRVAPPWLEGWEYRCKRWLDIGGALFGVVVLSPVFVAIAIAIKITSPGPVFFCQQRVGLHGKPFQVYKFRTMVNDADRLQGKLEQYNQNRDGVLFKLKNDPRITPIGRFLRRTSLDELPQLFNVLLGQMSLVGPRPLPLRDVERFSQWHRDRHQVLPGITGLWQISGRSNITDFDDAARLDLYYIDNWSLNLDLEILAETVCIVLFGKGAY